MKKLPDIRDDAAMLERGKRGALMSARNDACESLRNVSTYVQSAQIESLSTHADELKSIAARLVEIEALWNSL